MACPTDVFAEVKVHRCQNDVARRLVDADGRLRSFEEWRDSVLPITSHQCGQWLRTEYNTAVLRAQQAADWKRFEEYADVLPNLEWMPSTSATPGADHQVFWHTVRPVNDPFWNQHRPGDRWNCKCSLEATDAPVTEIPRTGREIADGAQAGLENNPGVDGKIFSETHPYVTEAYPGAKEAVERIVNMSEAKIARLSAKHLQGKSLSHPKFPHTIQISGNSIKEWTNQPHMHYAEKNAMLLDILKKFPQTTYLGVNLQYSKKAHVKASHIFEVSLSGDLSWIIVREYDNGEFVLHSITDSPKIKEFIT